MDPVTVRVAPRTNPSGSRRASPGATGSDRTPWSARAGSATRRSPHTGGAEPRSAPQRARAPPWPAQHGLAARRVAPGHRRCTHRRRAPSHLYTRPLPDLRAYRTHVRVSQCTPTTASGVNPRRAGRRGTLPVRLAPAPLPRTQQTPRRPLPGEPRSHHRDPRAPPPHPATPRGPGRRGPVADGAPGAPGRSGARRVHGARSDRPRQGRVRGRRGTNR